MKRAFGFAIVTPFAWIVAVEAARRLPLPNDFGAALFVALIVGCAQAAALRAWLWIAATVAGAFSAEIVLGRIGFSHPILALPLGALVTGLCHGVPQALVLRSRIWAVVAPVAFFTGGIVLVLMGTLRTVATTFTLPEIAALSATIGVIEGLALAMLPRRREARLMVE